MSRTFQDPTERPGPAARERAALLRMVAGALALLTLGWAVFGTVIMVEDETWAHGPWRKSVLVWGSSYVIAIALAWRALGRPSLKWRRAIWALASLVQGAWVALMVIETFVSRGGGSLPGLFFMMAFAGSTCLSFGAALCWNRDGEKPMAKVKSVFLDFVRCVVSGDIDEVARRLAVSPSLATTAAEVGASRGSAVDFFFREIMHYLYAGDTALHMAAAGFRRPVAKLLVAHGADCRARNRRGAEPLHYAADANHWEPAAQGQTIAYLLSVGADANALDNSGVTPLHRAVRTRSLAAVRALLDGGAKPQAKNKAGSTPLHLAVQTTGRGGSGSENAHEQQAGIIELLVERGASLTAKDRRGKSVRQAATSEWVRDLLA